MTVEFDDKRNHSLSARVSASRAFQLFSTNMPSPEVPDVQNESAESLEAKRPIPVLVVLATEAEINAEKVPLIQKEIIHACNEAGKPVITATQMLESMILHPRPTRAETSDVANAILDGTDAVMLSGETASGGFPVEAVRTMVKIALDVERSGVWRDVNKQPAARSSEISVAVAEAACHAAATVKAKSIVVFTQSGATAARIARFRPQLPIIAFTSSREIRCRLALYWGVRALPVGVMEESDQQIDLVEETLMEHGFRKGDVVVITMGIPLGSIGSTNMMKVHKLGEKGV